MKVGKEKENNYCKSSKEKQRNEEVTSMNR